MSDAVSVEHRLAMDDAKDDPFRYGWRYVRRVLPDGSDTYDEIPLTLEDLLYPEEGDHAVHEPEHTRDFVYCHSNLEGFYAGRPEVVVLGDCRVDWGVAGVRPLGPDILVLFEVRTWRRAPTFHVATEGGRPVLVIEIASPSTRRYDLGTKLALYHQVGVEKYVIVDRGPANADPVRLLGYQRGPTDWLPLSPTAQGRLDLAPVALQLGIEEERPWLYDTTTGARLPDCTEWQQTLSQAQTRAHEAENRAHEAESRAHEAAARAQAEVQARLAAEARAAAEAQARLALEARLRALEEQQRGQD